jgi:hypothetical protein
VSELFLITCIIIILKEREEFLRIFFDIYKKNETMNDVDYTSIYSNLVDCEQIVVVEFVDSHFLFFLYPQFSLSIHHTPPFLHFHLNSLTLKTSAF